MKKPEITVTNSEYTKVGDFLECDEPCVISILVRERDTSETEATLFFIEKVGSTWKVVPTDKIHSFCYPYVMSPTLALTKGVQRPSPVQNDEDQTILVGNIGLVVDDQRIVLQ